MLASVALGALVGLLLAVTGAGGGILAVPLLVFGLGLGIAQAGPIALMAVGLAAAGAALLGLRAGTVRYRAALLIAGAGMLLAPAGLWLAARIDNRALSIVFALVLLYVAIRAWRSAYAGAAQAATAPACIGNPLTRRFAWTAPCALALSLGGMLAGLLSGLLGVGGGFVMVPVLRRHTDLAMPSVVATSLAVIALVSLAGVAASAASGSLDWGIAWPFTGGALAGMFAGRAIAARLAGPQLQAGFGIVAGIVALSMLARAAS